MKKVRSMANPILIVGAGPVGLTAAAALTHHGLSCRIIDKAPAPSDKSKALAVWCRTMELLGGLGLGETFVQSGLKLKGGSVYSGGRRLMRLMLTSDESPYGFPLMIPQNVTERLLTEHLREKGVSVERQVELVTFGESANGVLCTLLHADGRVEHMKTPWAIGCDGAHSTVRHNLGLEFTGHAEPNDWMLADVRIDGPLARDEVSIYWHDRGVIVFFPIAHNRSRMIADLGKASDLTLKAELTLAEAQAKTDELGPGGLTLSEPIWLSYFRINARKVSDYRKGRVMLAGDAAHVHSPAGGQGMNTGMQDVFNLAWKLAAVQEGRGQAEPLLRSYSIERSAVGDWVLKNAERLTTISTLRNPVARWLRNHIVPIIGSLEARQENIRNDWFELSVNYRHSPLSAEKWPRRTGGLLAGERLGEAPLTSAVDGHRASVFNAILGKRHALLLLPGTQGREAESRLLKIAADAKRTFPGVLTPHLILRGDGSDKKSTSRNVAAWYDTSGELYARLQASEPTLILIRPDGYIGFRCQPADGRELMAHLDSYLIRPARSGVSRALDSIPSIGNALEIHKYG